MISYRRRSSPLLVSREMQNNLRTLRTVFKKRTDMRFILLIQMQNKLRVTDVIQI
jgi:hypothetical protein